MLSRPRTLPAGFIHPCLPTSLGRRVGVRGQMTRILTSLAADQMPENCPWKLLSSVHIRGRIRFLEATEIVLRAEKRR
jgi:hypothetical protein